MTERPLGELFVAAFDLAEVHWAAGFLPSDEVQGPGTEPGPDAARWRPEIESSDVEHPHP